jgi:transcription antitermination factor NusG
MPRLCSSGLIDAYCENSFGSFGIPEEIPWYVIHTCCHHEARLEERLRLKGLEVFLPRYLTASRRRDRKKVLQVPLFPGYLFIHDALDSSVYYELLKLLGVVRVLANSTGLLPVPGETIESIKLAVAGNRPHYPYPYLIKGKRVRVMEGPLVGVVGIILEAKKEKRKVVIEVEIFHRALAVELEDEAVELWQ